MVRIGGAADHKTTRKGSPIFADTDAKEMPEVTSAGGGGAFGDEQSLANVASESVVSRDEPSSTDDAHGTKPTEQSGSPGPTDDDGQEKRGRWKQVATIMRTTHALRARAAGTQTIFTPDFSPSYLSSVDRTIHLNIVRCTRSGTMDTASMTHRLLLDELDEIQENSQGTMELVLSEHDICKVDPQFAKLMPPLLIVSGDTVLFSLGSQGLGAILLRDRIYLLMPADYASNQLCLAVQERLQLALDGQQASCRPFQFLCLEALLICATVDIDVRASELVAKVEEKTADVHAKTVIFEDDKEGTAAIVEMRTLKQKAEKMKEASKAMDLALTTAIETEATMLVIQQSVEQVRSERLSEPVLDRQGMGLRRRYRNAAALLLEYYVGQIRQTTVDLDRAIDSLNGHETFATLLLDHARNRLLTFEILLAGASLSMGVGASVAGIFGMNTPTPIMKEDAPEWYFILIVLTMSGFMILVCCCVCCLLFFPKLKRRAEVKVAAVARIAPKNPVKVKHLESDLEDEKKAIAQVRECSRQSKWFSKSEKDSSRETSRGPRHAEWKALRSAVAISNAYGAASRNGPNSVQDPGAGKPQDPMRYSEL